MNSPPLSISLHQRRLDAEERLRDWVDLFIAQPAITCADLYLRHSALRLLSGYPDRQMFRRLSKRITKSAT